MLSSAGLKCPGRYPAFEDSDFDADGYGGKLSEYDAVKIIDPQRQVIDYDGPVTIIWIDRDFMEQAKSFTKMINVFFNAKGPTTRTELNWAIKNLKKDRADAIRKLSRLPKMTGNIIYLKFENIIKGKINKLAEKLNLDADVMRENIIKRGPKCYQGMIEVKLMKDNRAR